MGNTYNKNSYNLTARLIDRDGKTIDRCATHKVIRFKRFLRQAELSEGRKMYLRVYYGQDVDAYGDKTGFYNDGEYETKKELMFAFDCFYE